MLPISIINGSVTKIKNRSSTFVSLEKHTSLYNAKNISFERKENLLYMFRGP